MESGYGMKLDQFENTQRIAPFWTPDSAANKVVDKNWITKSGGGNLNVVIFQGMIYNSKVTRENPIPCVWHDYC